MGVLTILFIVVCTIFLPLGQLVRIPFGGFTIVGLDLAVFLTALIWGIKKIIKHEKPGLFFLPVSLFLGTGVISLLANVYWLKGNELFVSFLYLVRLASFFSFIWITRELFSLHQDVIRKSMLVGGGIVMILGFLQYVFFPSLQPYLYLGWDNHFYRVFSTFLDPNFVGAFLVLYLFYVFFFLLKNYQDKIRRMGFSLLFFFTLVAVLLTYSRSAYIMLGVGFVVYLWMLGKRKLIVGVLIGLAVVIVLLGVFHRYGEGNNLLRRVSIQSRLGSMSTALAIFTKEPIFGVGFDSYRYAQRRYGFLPGNIWEVTHAGAGTSNSFLFVLATTGIVGLGTYLFFLYKLFTYGNRAKNKAWKALLSASLLSLYIHALFENTLFYPSIMLWLFMLVGIIG